MAFPTPSRIDHAILIDRGSDLVSPLCTQLTYEGLLDEAYGLRCGQVTLSSGAEVAGGKSKVHGLNSGDAVFKQARGKFYVSARRWINETLRTIQQFRDQGIHTADIAEIRGFVAELKETFTRLPQHTALVEALAAVFQSPLFTERAAVEAQLLDGSDALEGVRDLIFRGESLEVVLRLLCLSCVVHGGVPKKAFESLRRDILNAYGHGHLVSLHRLQRAGLLTRGDGRRSSFGLVREAFKLLAHEGQFSPEADPEDIYFAYAGYAPLSVRLVQQCVTKGWKDAPTALQFVPGPTFDLVPDLDDDGHPTMVSYQSQMSTPPKPQAPGRRPLVLVVFLGGVTAAEIAALRFLSAKALVPCDFAVATTRMVTGSTLVSEFLESDPAAASGSQPVNWHGESFPYLMHHPRGAQGPSYRNAEPAHAEAPRRTAHGVWDGPAPRGANVPPSHASDTGAPAPTSRAAPRETLLRTGAKLPLVGLGTYQLDRASAVVEALEAGYRLVDCAAVYANERTVGEGIRAWLAAGGRREELFVIGKIWNDAHRPAEAIQSARQSVEDLGCDYLDCLLVHWPEAWVPGTKEPDAEVTLPQTWAALETLVDGGLVRSLGVSNFSLRQLDELSASARVPPAICQVELHPLLSQRALVGGLRRRGVAPVAYSPLGHGKEGLLATPRVRAVAQELGKSPAQVLLRWNVQREVAVIPKAGSLPHLCENIDVFDFQLSYQHKTALDALDCGKRFVTNDWHVWE
ncbi:aldo/keto reductase [Helicosporidium sp. ATCC 50920]|nr:aldo/keto reductase [Helicosporidium sp. ATCC 50920]|eukprot:KDD74976.1 aldo/keto reductase [Helicosporidium sp. ATCC 50920]